MTVRVTGMTFDCADAAGLATFWGQMLGWNVFTDADPEVVVAPHYPEGDDCLLFIPVPEGKTAKNRLHLDLSPTDCTRDEQIAKALDLGASMLDDRREADGTGWAVMHDPEGNEFCIVRSDGERHTPPSRTFRLDSL